MRFLSFLCGVVSLCGVMATLMEAKDSKPLDSHRESKAPSHQTLNGYPTGYPHSSSSVPSKLKGDNFYKSNALTLKQVRFKNLFGLSVAGNLFTPKSLKKGQKLPAIVVGHPMGATKEQSSNLYAQRLAEMGFVTLAIDLSYWGESASDGRYSPRNAVLPDMYVEDFSAALDFLRGLDMVDSERIGALGICGSGSFALAAGKIDSRIKAIATISMYDMGDASRHGLRGSTSLEARKQAVREASAQRDKEFQGGGAVLIGGTTTKLEADTNAVQREFYDFYRTSRGAYAPKGMRPDDTTKPALSSNVKFLNFYPLEDLDLLSGRALLFISGEEAHSREFSEKAYKQASEPKELLLVPNAGHVDLYDRAELIPFDKLGAFFKQNLK